jgi:hypothetical protein
VPLPAASVASVAAPAALRTGLEHASAVVTATSSKCCCDGHFATSSAAAGAGPAAVVWLLLCRRPQGMHVTLSVRLRRSSLAFTQGASDALGIRYPLLEAGRGRTGLLKDAGRVE